MIARYASFALPLAFVGLPLYVLLPQYYATQYGMDIALIGSILLVIRLIDAVQDPLLGMLADYLPTKRPRIAIITAIILALCFSALFIGLSPAYAAGNTWLVALWFAVFLVLTSTAYSLLMILYYARGVSLAQERGISHQSLSGTREGAVFIGVITASVLPPLLSNLFAPREAYMIYAGFFVMVLAVTATFIHPLWRQESALSAKASLRFADFYQLLALPRLRHLLLVFCINTLPVAVTSTLFLFYVEDVIQSPGHAGPMLGLFFLAAAAGAGVLTTLAERYSVRRVLSLAMCVSMSGMVWASSFGAGDVAAFYVFCTVTGFAIGGEMAILPALYSAILESYAQDQAKAFGLWNLASKASLALAAGAILPILAALGYQPGGEQIAPLAYGYALVPAALKLLALIIFRLSSIGKETAS